MSENAKTDRPVATIDNLREIGLSDIVPEAQKMKQDGWRLVALTCTELDADTVDILYQFDRDLHMENLRVACKKAEPVPSISGVYFAALLVENEIQGHFGLCFDGLVVDYGQTLLLDEEMRSTPFCKYSVATKAGQ